MAFQDHKISQFTHRISDLPDQPDLSPADLKARFDSAPEQLRQAHNAVCDDAARLDERVSGIVAETFGDAIPKTMLTEELQSEIEGKADDAANTAAHETMQRHIAQKCEIYLGFYTGDGEASQFIDLGFTPKAVLTCPQGGNGTLMSNSRNSYGGMALSDLPAIMETRLVLQIEENGFRAYGSDPGGNSPYIRANLEGMNFVFWAVR